MSGLYPLLDGRHLLVVSIGDLTAEVVRDYLEVEGGPLDDAVADLIELGEIALEARRADRAANRDSGDSATPG